MPTDPATVPLLTDADVEREFNATEDPDRLYVERLDAYPNGFGERMRTFAARIYALAASRVDTAEVERRAASKALVALKAEVYRGTSRDRMAMLDLITEHLQKLWPAPRECVLSDGSVVIVERQFERFNRGNGTRYAGLHFWREILDDTDTGADFDALKRFAAEVGQ
jgi:hypothetical protein